MENSGIHPITVQEGSGDALGCPGTLPFFLITADGQDLSFFFSPKEHLFKFVTQSSEIGSILGR